MGTCHLKFLTLTNMSVRINLSLSALLLLFFFQQCDIGSDKPRILVFNKTEFYFHESTSAGLTALRRYCEENRIRMDVTDDAESFEDDNLRKYHAVVFLNTAGDIFNMVQETSFKNYIHAGGSFVAIHTAIDTEQNWEWYGKLIGAHFESQSEIEKAILKVEDLNHPATQLPDTSLSLKDEWFNLKDISPDIQILLSLDENSYKGGIMGNFHPVSWYHDFEGGRVFVTTMGHTIELYNDPIFLKHLTGGLKYVMANNRLPDYTKVYTNEDTLKKPKNTGFVKTSMACDLFEPMEMDIFPDGKIIFIERRGAIKVFDPESRNTKVIGRLDVFIKEEGGLLGIAIDPNWQNNHWVYFYYTPKNDNYAIRLSRFVFENNSINHATEKVLLKVPTSRNNFYHAAGCLKFDGEGFLYIATGDNTPHGDGYSSIDERRDHVDADAQRSSANSMDLRGKILRIKPLPDGSYLCPEGNLYVNNDIILPPASAQKSDDSYFLKKIKGSFNITALGKDKPNNDISETRQNSKISNTASSDMDSVYSSSGRPEIFVMGVRNPFRISFDDRRHTLYWGDVGPDAGVFDSLRGPEGYDEINSAQAAGFYGWPYFIGPNKAYRDYDYDSQKSGDYFDIVHTINNSLNNTGARYLPPARPPLIWYSYRSTKEFPLVANGTRCAMAGPTYYCDKYPDSTRFPIRYNGSLIIYDWMRNWINAVTLDSLGNYVKMERMFENLRFNRPVDILIDKNGTLWMLEYGIEWYSKNPDACLSRIDFVNGKEQASAQPGTNITTTLTWDFFNRNRSFYQPGGILPYKLQYSDPETERLVCVNINIQYIEADQSADQIAKGHLRSAKNQSEFSEGQILIDRSDCKSCHALDRKVNGPAYLEISSRYSDDKPPIGTLTQKILNGGSGNWGDRTMIAHPQLNPGDVNKMVGWILSLREQSKKRIPREGRYSFSIPESTTDNGGMFVFHSSINDGFGETIIFRPHLQQVEKADSSSGTFRTYKRRINGEETVLCELKDKSFFMFKEIDLHGIKSVEFEITVQQNQTGGGVLELHLDEAGGPLLGSIAIPASSPSGGGEIKRIILPAPQSAWPKDAFYHDLFFLLKNKNAGAKPVLGMNWVRFNLK